MRTLQQVPRRLPKAYLAPIATGSERHVQENSVQRVAGHIWTIWQGWLISFFSHFSVTFCIILHLWTLKMLCEWTCLLIWGNNNSLVQLHQVQLIKSLTFEKCKVLKRTFNQHANSWDLACGSHFPAVYANNRIFLLDKHLWEEPILVMVYSFFLMYFPSNM